MSATKGPATKPAATRDNAARLIVNPIDCAGHGACAELLPEVISLDEWGYPVIDPRPLPPGLARPARAAVSACPALALRLVRG